MLHTAILLLWAAMQALTVLGVANYRRHVPRERLIEAPPGVAVIAAVRGPWPGAARLVAAILAQEGGAPRLILALSGEDDPAWAEIATLREAHPDRIRIVLAGVADDEGQKIHKLRAALAALDDEDRYLVFLDTDIAPPPRLIGRLLFPIVRGKAAIASGYRLLLPPPHDPIAALVAAIDLQVATLPRPSRLMLPWGGATAMARGTADRLDLANAWAGRLSDDLTLARLARAAGLVVRPVRDLLIASPMKGSAVAFGARQYRHLFFNLPAIWLGATAVVLAQAAGWAWALTAGGWPALAIGYAAAWSRAALRAAIVRDTLPAADRAATRRALAWDCLLPFVVAWSHTAFALAGAAARTMRWGAFDYVIAPGGKVTRVTKRPPSAASRRSAP